MRPSSLPVLLPRLAEAEEAAAPGGNAGRDVTRVFAQQAARSSSASRWLGTTTVETPTRPTRRPSTPSGRSSRS